MIADIRTDQAVGRTNPRFKDDETASVAYSAFPAYRGHGIAPRVSPPLTTWAFGDLGSTVLLLEADKTNSGSDPKTGSLHRAAEAGQRALNRRSTGAQPPPRSGPAQVRNRLPQPGPHPHGTRGRYRVTVNASR